MIPFKDIKTIFFDYDGTLHDSIKIYAPAFRKAYDYLVEAGQAEKREWSDQVISYWLGYNPQDMWKNFMPKLDESLKVKCSSIISNEMKSLIESGRPVLYENALETLAYLKERGYRLVFISNCKLYYKQCHCRLFNLERYFESMVCSDEYDSIPKHEILKKIMNNYPKDMVIVGDRKQDIEAGIKNNIYTIGCTYGFAQEGELEKAHLLIDNIMDLIEYL